MPQIDLRGMSLHYRLEGESQKPVIALSNSLGADVSMWDGQMAALLGSFRVLRYDTRGHGQTTMPAGETSLRDLGQDLLALLDSLSLDRVHLCGVSLGGLTAMWVALHARQRLHSLVLSNTSARIGSVASWDERIQTVQSGGLAAISDALPQRWFSPGFLADANKVEPQKRMLLRCSLEGYVGASAAIRDADLRSQVAEIAVPTLILSGSEDPVTPPSDGMALHAAIAGSIFQEVPGAHLSNIEHPEPYNRALLSFLQQSRPTPTQEKHHG